MERLDEPPEVRRYGLPAAEVFPVPPVEEVARVAETRPLSKTKRYRLLSIVRKSQLATVTGALETEDVSKVKGGMKGKKKDETPATGAPAKAETPSKGKEKK